MQPYLFPYLGYFQLINVADKFVLYDDVNYIKKGWINRNNIIINGQKKLLTISLASASQNKLINEIEISDNFNKFLKTLKLNYSKAPFFKPTMALIEKVILYENRNLSLFIKNSLEIILDYLNITSELFLSSDIKKNNALKGQHKIIAICKELNATAYINPIGGIELYNKDYFNQNNIKLYFIKTSYTTYNQFSTKFEPFLSIIDILMHNSPVRISQMMNDFILLKTLNEK